MLHKNFMVLEYEIARCAHVRAQRGVSVITPHEESLIAKREALHAALKGLAKLLDLCD